MSTILIIEDDPTILDNVVDLLEAEGFDVLAAEDGRIGLLMAQQHQPDLILCDVMMPHVDGHTVLRGVQANPALEHTPFLFLSALAEREDIRQGMNLGADDYLTKPFRAQELLESVWARLAHGERRMRGLESRLAVFQDSVSRVIPHELRTPLGAVLGLGQVLREDWRDLPPHEVDELLDLVVVSSRRLETLAEKLTHYSTLRLAQAHPAQLQQLQQAVTPHAHRCVTAAARGVAQQHGREDDVTLDVAPVALALEETLLARWVTEIVENAFKFSEPGQHVQVTGWGADDGYKLRVSDEGRGLTGAQQRQITAFVQFDRLRNEQQGLGMGLALARLIADIYAAQLDVESAPEQGTTLTVTWPVAEDEHAVECATGFAAQT